MSNHWRRSEVIKRISWKFIKNHVNSLQGNKWINSYMRKMKGKHSPLLMHGNGDNSVNNYALTNSIGVRYWLGKYLRFSIYGRKKKSSSTTITMPGSSIHWTNQIFIKNVRNSLWFSNRILINFRWKATALCIIHEHNQFFAIHCKFCLNFRFIIIKFANRIDSIYVRY